jgi:hypothetical protein
VVTVNDVNVTGYPPVPVEPAVTGTATAEDECKISKRS